MPPEPTKAVDLTDQVREAVREEVKAQYSRRRALEAYAQKMDEADNQVTDFIRQAIKETTRAHRTAVALHVVSYLVVASVLISGLYLILFTSIPGEFSWLAVICLFAGIIGAIYLHNRNPVRNVRYMVDNLVKLNVIFAAYLRQIHQVDVIFEDMFAAGKEIEITTSEQLLKNLQDAMTEAITAVSQMSITLEE